MNYKTKKELLTQVADAFSHDDIESVVSVILRGRFKWFDDVSRSEEYPKTLMIRNHVGGMIWQVYHVQKEIEAIRLCQNACKNGFHGSTLEDYQPDVEETAPDWRETDGGKEITKD